MKNGGQCCGGRGKDSLGREAGVNFLQTDTNGLECGRVPSSETGFGSHWHLCGFENHHHGNVPYFWLDLKWIHLEENVDF